jgi:hypothetical protein
MRRLSIAGIWYRRVSWRSIPRGGSTARPEVGRSIRPPRTARSGPFGSRGLAAARKLRTAGAALAVAAVGAPMTAVLGAARTGRAQTVLRREHDPGHWASALEATWRSFLNPPAAPGGGERRRGQRCSRPRPRPAACGSCSTRVRTCTATSTARRVPAPPVPGRFPASRFSQEVGRRGPREVTRASSAQRRCPARSSASNGGWRHEADRGSASLRTLPAGIRRGPHAVAPDGMVAVSRLPGDPPPAALD